MAISQAQNRAVNRYTKKTMRRFTLQLHSKYEADIIAWLEDARDNGSGYNAAVKRLIREEIERNSGSGG